ncbi:Gfo/Idh/MocA family oxidoreductase [bacterium]|nr:Gfo/Idh/MocA family oxidoreductase [bacterium]
MKFAILGCGYVADAYLATRSYHPQVEIVSCYDLDTDRMRRFGEAGRIRAYESFEQLLADSETEAVINLTNPREHFKTTEACLLAGKHVYSEKPVGMDLVEVKSLQTVARAEGKRLCTAPCSALSPAALTLGNALNDGLIGKVRLVYAQFDDGYIAPLERPWTWENTLGCPWPAVDEFEVGCTYEHAGYFLSWLLSYFGSVRSMTSFASTQIPEKGKKVETMAPDFTCGCLQFDNAVVARVTCGLVAPLDKSILIVGDTGTLSLQNLRDDYGDIVHSPYEATIAHNRKRNALRRLPATLRKIVPDAIIRHYETVPCHVLPLVDHCHSIPRRAHSLIKRADFLRGPAELASAITSGREPLLGEDFGAHMVEIIKQLQYPAQAEITLETAVPDTLASQFQITGKKLLSSSGK